MQIKRIAFSFDDAPGGDGSLLDSAEHRTARLVSGLAQGGISQAAFFVAVGHLDEPSITNGCARIAAYTRAGHVLGNHGYDHLGLADTPADSYLADLDRAARWLDGQPGSRPWFRYPYLDEGDDDPRKRAQIRDGLRQRGLSNGYITVRSADYHLNDIAGKARASGRGLDFDALRDLHIETLVGSANFYDRMAVRVIGRSPAHVILLHENDLNALFIAEIADAFRRFGWEIVSADDAYQDPISASDDSEWNGSGRVTALAIASGVATDLVYEPIELEPLAHAFEARVLGSRRSS